MKNKGFTLIELLAVIVILAIIALIATPIILGIINDARDESRERTAELIANEIELAYSVAFMDEGTEPTLDEVFTAVNMDNVTKDEATKTITATNGAYCTLSGTNSLTVTCSDGVTASTVTMALATTATS